MSDLNLLLTLIPFLRAHQARGITVAEVAAHLNTTDAVVHDLVNQIIMCGVPPYYPNDYVQAWIEADGRIVLRIAEHFSRPLGFTAKEVAVLRAALDSAAADASADVRATLDGLAARLGEIAQPAGGLAGRPDASAAGTVAMVGPTERARERARQLREAAEQHRTVAIEHFSTSRDALVTRDIDPLGLVHHGAHLYCAAHDHLRDADVHFRVDRIRSVKPTDRTFTPPDAERLDVLLGAAIEPKGRPGRAGKRFTVELSSQAAQLAREWWDARAFKAAGDGRVRFSAAMFDENFPCVFALPYGADAEIVSPPEVRDVMAARLDRAIAQLA